MFIRPISGWSTDRQAQVFPLFCHTHTRTRQCCAKALMKSSQINTQSEVWQNTHTHTNIQLDILSPCHYGNCRPALTSVVKCECVYVLECKYLCIYTLVCVHEHVVVSLGECICGCVSNLCWYTVTSHLSFRKSFKRFYSCYPKKAINSQKRIRIFFFLFFNQTKMTQWDEVVIYEYCRPSKIYAVTERVRKAWWLIISHIK